MRTAWISPSPSAIPLARQMLSLYGLSAHLDVGDMTDLSFADGYFDCVVDVFSSYCIDAAAFERLLSGVARVLKPGGRFFTYTPGKESDAWRDCAPASKIDDCTLEGISRPTSAYFPSPYPFRFLTHERN